jgi:hypothetical protein
MAKTDRRAGPGYWRFKSKRFGPELRNDVRAAASQSQQPLGDWAAGALQRAALEVLGKPSELSPIPVRWRDMALYIYRLEARMEALESRVTQLLLFGG